MANRLLSYITRTYEQGIDTILGYMTVNLPEMTDHTLGNPFVRMVHVWLAMFEQHQYYIDDAANENFLHLARRYKSLVAHARANDYRIRLSSPATVDLTFELNQAATSEITIPINTQVLSESGNVSFWTTEVGTIAIGQRSVLVKAKQENPLTISKTINCIGGKWQQYALESNVSEGTVQVIDQTNEYYLVKDTLLYSKAEKVFVPNVHYDGTPIVQFGDGVTGASPNASEVLTVQWKETLGFNGNLKAYTLTRLATSLSLPNGLTIKVYNVNQASGGKGIDNVADIRKGIESQKRTLGTAIMKQDFQMLAEGVAGVLKAGVKSVCGKPLEVYIIPVGGGIASNTLKDSVYSLLEAKRVFGRKLEVKPTGVLRLLLSINVRLNGSYVETAKREEITAALIDFLSYQKQEIGGTLAMSDIYQIVEGIQGVGNSDIIDMRVKPYARPILGNETPLAWTVDLKKGSETTHEWLIGFVTSTKFNVFKNNELVKTALIGELIDTPEVSFTLLGAYTAGQKWSFVTYKGFGSVNTNEMSIIISDSSDINIKFI
jgi:hypothetical protein